MLFSKHEKKTAEAETVRKFTTILSFLLLLVIFSTLGIMFLEKWSFLDALWHTIITISTVGFGDVVPITDMGSLEKAISL